MMKSTIISRIISSGTQRILAGALCMVLALSAPIASLATEQRRGDDRQRTERRNDRNDRHGNRRPANSNNNQGTRPNKPNKPDKPNKPNKPVKPNKPDKPIKPEAPGRPNHPNTPNRPNHPGRPNTPGHNPGHKPSHKPSHGHQWRPGHVNHVRPGMPIHRPHVCPPPMRPYRPAHFYGYHRPTPPRGWRPAPRPLFSTVLGLTFGSAISVGIDALITSGYTVDGYSHNEVYVNDVVQLDLRWPFGMLQYDSHGRLAGSEFVYDSPWRDTGRYDTAYNRLCRLYGPPAERYDRRGELRATWWGPGGQFVTLRFDRRAPMSGPDRYFTTLSFGI